LAHHPFIQKIGQNGILNRVSRPHISAWVPAAIGWHIVWSWASARCNKYMREFFSRLLRIQLPIWLVLPMMGLTLALGLGGGYLGTQWFRQPSP